MMGGASPFPARLTEQQSSETGSHEQQCRRRETKRAEAMMTYAEAGKGIRHDSAQLTTRSDGCWETYR
jgi:hypothetical protein